MSTAFSLSATEIFISEGLCRFGRNPPMSETRGLSTPLGGGPAPKNANAIAPGNGLGGFGRNPHIPFGEGFRKRRFQNIEKNIRRLPLQLKKNDYVKKIGDGKRRTDGNKPTEAADCEMHFPITG